MAHQTREDGPAEQRLRESEERLSLAVRATRDGIWDLDLVNGRVWWNETYDQLFGPRPSDSRDSWEWWIDRLHPDDRERVSVGLREALDGEAEYWSAEYRFQRADGSYADVIDRACIARDDTQARRVVGAMTDITERKHAEDDLRTAQLRLDALARNEIDLICEISNRGEFRYCSRNYASCLGYEPEELVGTNAFDMMHPDDKEKAREIWRRGVSGDLVDPDLEDVFRVRHRNGSWRWFVGRGVLVDDASGNKHIITSARDVTERRALERDLAQSIRERALTEERQRRRIALAVHDGIGQLLPLARTKLSLLTSETERVRREQLTQELDQLIKEAHESATALSMQLDPPVLREVGLVAAARGLAEEMAKRYGLKVLVEEDDCAKPLGYGVETELFRSLRELLINVAKHADVDSAHVKIECQTGRVQVSVADDGVGFEPGGLSEKNFGLRSVLERLEYLGGNLQVHSAPGQGTRVRMVAPLATPAS